MSADIGTCYFCGLKPIAETLSVAQLATLGVTLVCVVGAQKLASDDAERPLAKEWLQQVKAAGIHTRCGFSDAISKEEARQTFRTMVALGVNELGCGREHTHHTTHIHPLLFSVLFGVYGLFPHNR